MRGKEINLGATMGKQIASIFAYLILHRDRAVAKEQLIEIFWPDSRNPLNALKFAIFRLRKALEELPGAGGPDWIQTVRGGYRLNPCLLYTSIPYSLILKWRRSIMPF